MNKVIAIHLNGTAFQLEEAGFETLRQYLDHAAQQLGDNPDRVEIVADIEQAIADKCRALLSGYRTVILTREIEQIIGEMGPVEGGTTAAGPDQPASGGGTGTPGPGASDPAAPPPAGGPGTARRVYRLPEGAMLGGICSGLAAYFNLDPTIVRLVFVVLAFLTGGGMALAYLILLFVLPVARTPAERSAAQGTPETAQEFIRRAREGYYGAARTFGDRQAHRAWRRRFRQEMRQWKHNLRREWRTQAPHWQSGAAWSWTGHPGAYRGWWFTLSLLALIRGLLTVALIYGIVMLAAHGAVFGIAAPASMPLWVAILILCLVFHVVSWPFRAAKHALRHAEWGGPQGPAFAFFAFWDALVWLAVVALMIWLGDRYVPAFHEALTHLPQWIRDLGDSIRDAWNQRHP